MKIKTDVFNFFLGQLNCPDEPAVCRSCLSSVVRTRHCLVPLSTHRSVYQYVRHSSFKSDSARPGKFTSLLSKTAEH